MKQTTGYQPKGGPSGPPPNHGSSANRPGMRVPIPGGLADRDESLLLCLYHELRSYQQGCASSNNVGVGGLNPRLSAIFLAVESLIAGSPRHGA